jgi:hypothetical protein
MAKCGDCKVFQPKRGANPARPDKEFFNCTKAKMLGMSVGMQVKADSDASKCESFTPK